MTFRELTTFDDLLMQEQRIKQLSKEKKLELHWMNFCVARNKDLFDASVGSSRSVGQQTSSWLKTLSEKEKANNLLLINLKDLVENFKEYVLVKYRDKNNQKQVKRWKLLFEDDDFFLSCTKIIAKKIYDYKLESSINGKRMFLNQDAYSKAFEIWRQKEVEKICNKAVSRGNNLLKKGFEKDLGIYLDELSRKGIDATKEEIVAKLEEIADKHKKKQRETLVTAIRHETGSLKGRTPNNNLVIDGDVEVLSLEEIAATAKD